MKIGAIKNKEDKKNKNINIKKDEIFINTFRSLKNVKSPFQSVVVVVVVNPEKLTL